MARWVLAFLLPMTFAQVNVTTGHYDSSRTSANLNETQLKPSNVTPAQFGKLFSRAVDGYIYAQPLYLSGVAIPGKGVHNLVYVATMHNTVYAFDADDPSAAVPLWSASLGTPVPHEPSQSLTIKTVTAPVTSGPTLTPEIGILSTPVIDPTTRTLFVASANLENQDYSHKLHALDLATGAERPGSPVIVSGNVPGPVVFHSAQLLSDKTWAEQIQRAALALVDGKILIAFAVFHDPPGTPYPWHGWVMSYDTKTLVQTAVFCSTPAGGGGGIWQSGIGPAADADGNIFVATGNGDWDGKSNFSDTVLKLSGTLKLDALFSPPNQKDLERLDWDLGVAGPAALPGTRFLITGSKHGTLYLLDRELKVLDSFIATIPCVRQSWDGCSQIRQYALWSSASPPMIYLWGSPADHDTPSARKEVLRAYAVDVSAAKFVQTPVSMGKVTSGYPGGMVALSANGAELDSGIVWATTSVDNAEPGAVAGTLHAFAAADVSKELWNSDMNPGDKLGSLAKFALPTVANGKVYVPTFSGQLVVYGVRP